ncbi:tRNA (guanine-N(1)-)-methyltransferase [bacterium BMS3Abin07]|nr:tRNA (guanine-N(1)-)-methyltransferase [bacterium BMS3Abin07]GBE32580.1 tRNA (guanine-N(1)-)-methyltransferase [bacterium BMS3Bbin05]HDO21306.1 tRNA (guanosine(37)-N1)-methyltransferase TrmD [Nitrospirota bacterium]HDZ88851.1 tRNA (guanosine(37)-N1)-methyltransferase TrmD [Nitrospirota bacterium]
MIFEVLTIFPSIFETYFNTGILKKAEDKALVSFRVFNLRDFTHDRHKQVDDYPYGGGAGMVFKAEPVIEAVEHIREDNKNRKVIHLSPPGVPYSQKKAEQLRDSCEAMLFICGRYEGIDERIKCVVDEEISIGDYILSGGELAALVIIDSITRLIPGALGDENSSREESFSWGILDYPHYTRPRRIRGMDVPEVLLSGNHEKVRFWRRKQALRNTLIKRPDLFKDIKLDKDDKILFDKIKEELKHEQDKGN